jgi:hypothetical protein
MLKNYVTYNGIVYSTLRCFYRRNSCRRDYDYCGKRDEQQVCKDIKIVIEGTEAFIDQVDISKLIEQNYGSFAERKSMEFPSKG